MKKILALLVSLVMVFAFVAACGGDEPETAPAPTEAPATEEPVSEEPVDEEPVVEEPVDEEPPAPSFVELSAPISDDLVYWGQDDLLGYENPAILPGCTVIGDQDEISDNGSGLTMVAGEGLVFLRTDGPGVTVSNRQNPWDSLDVGITSLDDGDYVFMARVSAGSEIEFWLQLEANDWTNSAGEVAGSRVTGSRAVLVAPLTISGYESGTDQNRVRINASEGENYNIEAIAIFKAEAGQVYDATFDFIGFEDLSNMFGSTVLGDQDDISGNGSGFAMVAGDGLVFAEAAGGVTVSNRQNPWDSLDVGFIGPLPAGKYKVVAEVKAGSEIDFWLQLEANDWTNSAGEIDGSRQTGESATLEGEFEINDAYESGTDQNRVRINATEGENYTITSVKFFKIG